MPTRTTSAGKVAAAILGTALAASAAASAGNGIRLGGNEGRLHPYVEVENRYDSNVYYADGTTVGDVVVHVRPGFELAVPGELATAELSGNLDWAQYLGMDDRVTSSRLSKLYGQAALGLSLNRRGAIGLEVDDEFRRSQNTTALVVPDAAISNFNALRLRAPWRPGGGALVLALTGSWLLETFEAYFDAQSCGARTCADLGYNEVRGGGEARWRFLPRTSAVLQAGWFSRTPNDAAAGDVSGIEAQAGFTGLVTPHLGATVKGGYATTLGGTPDPAGAGPDVATWLATTEVEWIATDSASVRVGFAHGLGLDPGPLVFTSSRLYAGGRILLAGRYAVRGDVNWERRSYEGVSDPVTALPASASADVLRFEPAFEAGIARWMSASVGYAYGRRTSDFPAGSQSFPAFRYSKNETWLRLAVRY